MSARRVGVASLALVGALAAVTPASTPHRGAVVDSEDQRLTRTNGVLTLAGAPFTGIVETRTEDGALVERLPFREGRRDGLALAWYPDGAPRWERRFAHGRESGVHRGWYADGQIKFEERFTDGLVQGVAKEWFPDGTPYRAFTYVDGHEEGLQRMWYVDGEIRANYVVRNGRRFGSLGAKGCTGEDEEARDAVESDEGAT